MNSKSERSRLLSRILLSVTRRLQARILSRTEPLRAFHSHDYLRHNARRQEHLASLGIPVAGTSVLEVGAGIGDHTHYFLDRGCRVTITEAREDNLRLLRKRYPSKDIRHLDLEEPIALKDAPFDIVYCYGTLYHLSDPGSAIKYLSENCAGKLLLETCVSFGNEVSINPALENQKSLSQAISGKGCRPTRPWVMRELQKYFEFVYASVTQPNHEEFPIDWTSRGNGVPFSRAVFVGSRSPIDNPALSGELLSQQRRQV
jgi:2-polyprenyl-3-methyl-5-hydroxy-6-metoxy-1,4-benzoquinol methylase